MKITLLQSIFNSSIIILVSFIFTFFIIPLIINFGKKFNLIDVPNHRKQHIVSKINIGGLGMLLGLSLTLLVLRNYLPIFSYLDNSFWITIFCMIFIFLIGFIDDLIKLSPFFRMIIQISVSSFLWAQGFNLKILDLSILFNEQIILVVPDFLSWLITVIWFVGLINAINWIDGLDGLAAGIIIIASFVFLIIHLASQDYGNALIASLLLGICSSFFIYNKYPSKIIMGDGGSYLLGFAIASISLIGDHSFNSSIGGSYKLLEILIPILILFIPIADMAYVISSRICVMKSPFYPDRKHIHHRFLNNGLKHSDAVIKINFLTLPTSFIALYIKFAMS